ncbi:uncharacterized protein LAJ45_02036 [Morchella importuna]|uniref:uncharacterized protein n=1 Tax=Morchella importuna TaxID=1174673 RepID=UPI001E8CAAC7|nr:uncharacterized protein LAJ45_02036 [Morchella importuna]KAH8154268.1 hypothetical protein LAJ45_02036 [Morchella importuna]
MMSGPSSLRSMASCWTSLTQSLKIPTLLKPTLLPTTFTRNFIVAPKREKRRIKIHPPIKGPPKSPLQALTTQALQTLDPNGTRQKMFSRHNKDSIRPGDIVQVRRRNGDPFSGVLLNIRRRGVDSAFLLRDHLTRVGVEMWFKLYSPAIEDIDLVQRKAKRARRAKLYYMRQPKHDFGSVANVVKEYTRRVRPTQRQRK